MSWKVDWTTIKYSTTEEQVVGTWINGSPVYRRIIRIDRKNSTTGWVAYNYDNPIVFTNIIEMSGGYLRSGATPLRWAPINATRPENPAWAIGIGAVDSGGSIYVCAGAEAGTSWDSIYLCVTYVRES